MEIDYEIYLIHTTLYRIKGVYEGYIHLKTTRTEAEINKIFAKYRDFVGVFARQLKGQTMNPRIKIFTVNEFKELLIQQEGK